ncbi:Endonuclease III-like protein 1 [Geranomyces michiganensis]|nr:Endonuclease III-like protein 1 [Geranomyces michiganensis]
MATPSLTQVAGTSATVPQKRRFVKETRDGDENHAARPPIQPARRRQRIKVEYENQEFKKFELSQALKQESVRIESQEMEETKLSNAPALELPKEELQDWQAKHAATYEAIRSFRKTVVAPVDHSGCAMLGRRELGDKVYRFEVLVALILSAQTPDLKLGPLVREIQARFESGITAAALLSTPADEIRTWLQPIGMQNQKTRALLGASQMCVDDYGDDIPPTFEGLLKLPGVGPKIAALVMSNAWHTDVAIGVDTHVHRIANRLSWTKTKAPEKTMSALMDLVPQHLWGEMNPVLVGFGQMQCFARNPACATCPVQDRCPRIGLGILKF